MGQPVIPTDPVIWPLLTELASCLCQQITDSGLPEPCFCAILPGAEVAFDYCEPCEGGACGQAWVRLDSLYPSAVFPAPDVEGTCASLLAISVQVGIVRCAPVAGDDGGPPGLADQLDTAQLQVADALAIRRAVLCCGLSLHREHALGPYQPVGPLGGCVGGAWTATFSEVR